MKYFKTILLFMLFAASVIVATLLYFQQENDLRSLNFIQLQEKIDQKFWGKTPNIGNKIVMGPDAKNTSYFVGEDEIVLLDGREEKEVGGVLRTTNVILESTGDINVDGMEDTALVLEQTFGEKTQYFVVAAFQNALEYVEGSNVVLLNTDIPPTTIAIDKKLIQVQYQSQSGDAMVQELFPNGKFLEKGTVKMGEIVIEEMMNEETESEAMGGEEGVEPQSTEMNNDEEMEMPTQDTSTEEMDTQDTTETETDPM